MQVLLVVELGPQQGLGLEGSDGGETLQRGGELREDWGPGDSLQSLDISAGGHVEIPQSDKDHSQHQRGQNYPGTDQEYHSQDTSDVQTDLKEFVRKIFHLQFKLTVKTSNIAGGKSSSIEPMSLENLFKIRPRDDINVRIVNKQRQKDNLPTGFVSKNLQGALSICLKTLLWRETEEDIQREKKWTVLIMEDTTRERTMAV